MTFDRVKMLKAAAAIVAVFAPFIMVAYALAIVPRSLEVLRSQSGVDWIWLIMLGAMMVLLYYFLAVYMEDEEEIAEDFTQLDLDHDGYVTRADASAWKRLASSFDRFDADHDGQLSRVEFEAFEHSLPRRGA